MHFSRAFLAVAICFNFAAGSLRCGEPASTTAAGGKDQIGPEVWVLGSEWAQRLPPTGSVNVPAPIASLAPGQRISIAVWGQGPKRNRFFEGATLTAEVNSAGKAWTYAGLHPVTIRPIKADGADMTLRVLEAGGIAADKLAEIKDSTAMVTFCVFELPWTSPESTTNASVDIRFKFSAPSWTGSTTRLNPVHLSLRSWEALSKDPPPDDSELNAQLQSYRDASPPASILPLLAVLSRRNELRIPSAHEYLKAAFADVPSLRDAAEHWLPTACADWQRHSDASDPRQSLAFIGPLTPQTLSAVSHSMDRCWGAWSATGDPSYLRAIVNLLAYAPDFPAYEARRKSGAKGGAIEAAFARGLIYQIAGWSLSSFERSDGLVSDWTLYWETDPKVPAEIRNQLHGLLGNPAFRVEQP
ncbi:MAG TPA: hypothetical protein VGL42_01500 [Opitutaceae bacterium]|jgi:hypothetical protein